MERKIKFPATGGEIIKVNFQRTRPHDRPELEGSPAFLLELIEHLENGTMPADEPATPQESGPDG